MLRGKGKSCSFLPSCAETSSFLVRFQDSLDYVKMRWLLQVRTGQSVPACVGLVNVKARVLSKTGWASLAKPCEQADAMQEG